MVEGACQTEVFRSACRRRRTDGAIRGSRNTGVVRAKTLANAVVGTRHEAFPSIPHSALRIPHFMYIELHCHSAFSFLDGASLPQKLGLQAITGAELTLLDGAHVTLLAETPEGYANLCRLITEAHLGRADRR